MTCALASTGGSHPPGHVDEYLELVDYTSSKESAERLWDTTYEQVLYLAHEQTGWSMVFIDERGSQRFIVPLKRTVSFIKAQHTALCHSQL